MEKKINKKAIVTTGKTSPFIFLYPGFISLLMVVYIIKNPNINNALLCLGISAFLFITGYFSFKNRKILITKNSIYVYSGEKKFLHWSIQNDFLGIEIQQDRLGKIFNYGTVIIANKDKSLYQQSFIDNPELFKDNLMVSYENIMKKLDPNFVSSYKVTGKGFTPEQIDSIEE
jgi:hypothetical protein